MTTAFSICATCGVEYAHPLPEICPICVDERQYLPADSVQKWTTLDQLRDGHSIDIFKIEPGLHGIIAKPKVGIGQRSLLVQTQSGNLLWDPIGYIDNQAIAEVKDLGGIRWIAASHPHMYGVQLEWSAAFEDAEVLISHRDAEWLGRSNEAMHFWDGEIKLTPDLTLYRIGGHFPGSAVAHWTGRDTKGVLLSGDGIFPVAAEGWVTFMRSYPNRIPLSGTTVRRIADQVLALPFERLYGNFTGVTSAIDAHDAVRRSAERHIAWASGQHDDLT